MFRICSCASDGGSDGSSYPRLSYLSTQYFAMHRRIKATLTPHVAIPHVQPMALHTLSAIISHKKRSFIFFQMVLAALAVLIQHPFHVSS